tara:strand:- start:99 stop:395 length:297 start_codon:yes stop_codon:yes gene_type:complete
VGQLIFFIDFKKENIHTKKSMSNTSETNTKKRVGRKPVTVTWPEGEFTAQDVMKRENGKYSLVTIHSKLNKATKNQEVVIERVEKPKVGRPRKVYKKA